MRHPRVYRIAASILINNNFIRGYYTVFDNWVFSEANTDIEHFLSIEQAQEQFYKITSKFNPKIKHYYIINDSGCIVQQTDV